MYRYRVCEVEAYSSVILRKASRKGMRDGDVKDPVRDATRTIFEETSLEADSILEEEDVLPTDDALIGASSGSGGRRILGHVRLSIRLSFRRRRHLSVVIGWSSR